MIRQWTILREIERARTSGVAIDDLAQSCAVTTRTIRRDLQALEEAGFPIFDDRSRVTAARDGSSTARRSRAWPPGSACGTVGVVFLAPSSPRWQAPFKDDVEARSTSSRRR